MAVAIAEGLSALHWRARCNAQDVEFVIRTSRIPEYGHQARRTVNVWLLGFNLCTPITMDEKGCVEAAKASWVNDPYYPRLWTKVQPFHSLEKSVLRIAITLTEIYSAHAEDEALWVRFPNAYLESSATLFKQTREDYLLELPSIFIEKDIEEGKRRFPNGVRIGLAGPPRRPPKAHVDCLKTIRSLEELEESQL